MGLGRRFEEFKYSYIPGPGMYKLRGFAEDVSKKAEKLNRNKEKLTKITNANRKINTVSEMMEMLENENEDEMLVSSNSGNNITDGMDY